MDRNTRREIEKHFYSYVSSIRKISEREAEIIESGLVADPSRAASGNGRSDPTLSKALRLLDLTERLTQSKSDWSDVVYTVFQSYYFLRPDIYRVMYAKYIERLRPALIVKRYAHRNTVEKWRNRWLEIAYNIAIEKGLLK